MTALIYSNWSLPTYPYSFIHLRLYTEELISAWVLAIMASRSHLDTQPKKSPLRTLNFFVRKFLKYLFQE